MLRRDFVDLSAKLAVARILGSAQPHPAKVLPAARGLRERSHTLAPPYLDAHAHSASGLLLAYRAAAILDAWTIARQMGQGSAPGQ